MFEHVSIKDFEKRTGISSGDLYGEHTNADKIVSLRQMQIVDDLRAMPLEYLKQLLRSVTLNGSIDKKPYYGCNIYTARVDPNTVRIGQTFVQRTKYQDFLEKFQDAFSKFCVTKGIAKCTALIAFGKTEDGSRAIAHYIPPIVETHSGIGWLLLDGVHRNFLVKTVGTTLETVIIEHPNFDFPCKPQSWEKVNIVSEKPSKDKRFFNLNPVLFRNIKSVGIDG